MVSKTKIINDRKRQLSKSRYSATIQVCFVSTEKLLVKNLCNKKDLSIFCLLKESASILEQANRRGGGLKLGVFVTK